MPILTDGSFPAHTKSGHIEPSSVKKQHAKALKASGVAPFELYVLHHTCRAKWMDPFTFHRVAGHADMKTTMRHNAYRVKRPIDRLVSVRHNKLITLWLDGATRQDRTGDLLITNQPLYQLS